MTPSPALTLQSASYPADWYGKVPKRVRLLDTVAGEALPGETALKAYSGELHAVYVNSHGAVSAILNGGMLLGLKPVEFEIIEWHEKVKS